MPKTPHGRFLADLAEECLAHGGLAGYGKTVAIVVPRDGRVKRVPTIRVEAAVWTRYRGDPLAMKNDEWMVESIDAAIGRRKRVTS